MDEETISVSEKYLVTFDTRFFIHAENYDEVVEKMKSEIIRRLDEAVPMDTNLSIKLVSSANEAEQQSSYVDDWEFDDVW